MTLDDLQRDLEIYAEQNDPDILNRLGTQFIQWLEQQGVTELTREELESKQQEWFAAWENSSAMDMNDWTYGYGIFQNTDWLDDVALVHAHDRAYQAEKQKYFDEVAEQRALKAWVDEHGGAGALRQKYQSEGTTGNEKLDDLFAEAEGEEMLAREKGGGVPLTGIPELDKILGDLQKQGTEIHQVGAPGEGNSQTWGLDSAGNFSRQESAKYVGSYKQFVDRRGA